MVNFTQGRCGLNSKMIFSFASTNCTSLETVPMPSLSIHSLEIVPIPSLSIRSLEIVPTPSLSIHSR